MSISIKSLLRKSNLMEEPRSKSIQSMLDRECISIADLIAEQIKNEIKPEIRDDFWESFLADFDLKTASVEDAELFDYITMIVFDDISDRQPSLLRRYYKKFGSIKQYLSQLGLARWDYRTQSPVFN